MKINIELEPEELARRDEVLNELVSLVEHEGLTDSDIAKNLALSQVAGLLAPDTDPVPMMFLQAGLAIDLGRRLAALDLAKEVADFGSSLDRDLGAFLGDEPQVTNYRDFSVPQAEEIKVEADDGYDDENS